MQTVLALIFLIAAILLITGLFNPSRSLWWYGGDKTRKLSTIIYGIACVVIAGITGAVFAPPPPIEPIKPIEPIEKQAITTPSVPKDTIQILPDNIAPYATKEQIDNQFSSWDGSHYYTVKAVKKAMHDPKSFEHNQTSYVQNGNVLVVRMSYRGNNSLGAKVLSSVIAQVDAQSGDILSLNTLEQ